MCIKDPLEAIATETARVQERWTKALQVLVAAQAYCASVFGYPATSEAFMQYRAHLGQAAASSGADALAELKALDSDV